jgi:hypothetical protein
VVRPIAPRAKLSEASYRIPLVFLRAQITRILRGPTHSRPRRRLRSRPESMMLGIPSTLHRPRGCLAAAAARRNRSLWVWHLQVCSSVFGDRDGRGLLGEMQRQTHWHDALHPRTCNATARCRLLTTNTFLDPSKPAPVATVTTTAPPTPPAVTAARPSAKADSPLSLDSCRSTT